MLRQGGGAIKGAEGRRWISYARAMGAYHSLFGCSLMIRKVEGRGSTGHRSAAGSLPILVLALLFVGLTAGSRSEAEDGATSEALARPYEISEDREPCAEYAALRRPFFGDTHVHTTHSQDASTQDTRTTPREAYRFARGEPLGIQPWDEDGRALRTVQLDRPLDFAIVTDHANQLGEVHICKTSDLPGHDSLVCRLYRSFPRLAFFAMNARYTVFQKRWGFCGEDAEHCLAAAGTIWQQIQDAAEEAYDRSDRCAFTSFVGYEWTASGDLGHLHRNVVFRNERVPELPISVMETGSIAMNLWNRLDAECRDGRPGCEAITIPHNSNWSNGTAFTSAIRLRHEITSEEAPVRLRYDRLVEIMQHKGESECAILPGVTDEGCGFEKADDPHGSPFSDPPPREAVNFVRDALKRGVALEPALGANPLKFGVIGSTDTHLGTPGLVEERGFVGHGGAGLPATDGVPPGLPEYLSMNPGGLAVLWAEENARDALFEAMRRREAYATSGTRPTLRFFGGWGYGAEACAAADPALPGYAQGVPMGADLPIRPDDAGAPTFLVAAARDPEPSASALQRIEIVKGWVEDGERQERVMLVAGGPNQSSVDLTSCERRNAGQAQLCSVWRDTDFDPSEPAFYYARVLEDPSCRWSQWACVDAGVDCNDPTTIGAGFEPCCAAEHQPTIQERAWSSPIWYTPPGR
jgi:hypothetical protein